MSASADFNKYNFVTRTNASNLLAQSRILLQSNIKDGSKLLDVGTGDGSVTIECFIEKSGINFSKVVGSDFDVEHVKFANEKYKTSTVNFEVFDVSKEIPESIKMSAPFDVVTCIHMLHLLTHDQVINAVKNIKSLLKKDGLFYFFSPLNFCPPNLESTLMKKYPNGEAIPAIKFFTSNFKSENIRKVLIDEGFEFILFDNANVKYTFGPGEMKGIS